MGDERYALDLLVTGKPLLQCVDAFHDHFVHIGVLTELLTRVERYSTVACPLLNEAEFGYDECRYELALVGNDGHLVDVFVDQQHGFHHLRGNVFAV